jgi:hypothetical protein
LRLSAGMFDLKVRIRDDLSSVGSGYAWTAFGTKTRLIHVISGRFHEHATPEGVAPG